MISWIARCPVFQSPDYHGTWHRVQAGGTDRRRSVSGKEHRAQSKEHRAWYAWHREVAGEEGLGMGGLVWVLRWDINNSIEQIKRFAL